MTSALIQTGGKEPVVVLAIDTSGVPVTALSTLKIRVWRISDGFYFDWSDNTFKISTLVTIMYWVLSEVSSTYSPGEYKLDKTGHVNGFDTNTIVNPNDSDIYYVTSIEDSIVKVTSNFPQIGEIKVGGYIDDVQGIGPVIF